MNQKSDLNINMQLKNSALRWVSGAQTRIKVLSRFLFIATASHFNFNVNKPNNI